MVVALDLHGVTNAIGPAPSALVLLGLEVAAISLGPVGHAALG
jgi:hypothetical protein